MQHTKQKFQPNSIRLIFVALVKINNIARPESGQRTIIHNLFLTILVPIYALFVLRRVESFWFFVTRKIVLLMLLTAQMCLFYVIRMRLFTVVLKNSAAAALVDAQLLVYCFENIPLDTLIQLRPLKLLVKLAFHISIKSSISILNNK